MPTEQIGNYIIEYSGEPLKIGRAWGAYLTVYMASPNPAHRNSLLPRHRVGLDTVFLTQDAAEERAREVGIAKLAKSSHRG